MQTKIKQFYKISFLECINWGENKKRKPGRKIKKNKQKNKNRGDKKNSLSKNNIIFWKKTRRDSKENRTVKN